MNVNKLKGLIIANGMNVEQFADEVGMETSTMYRKLKKFEKITIGEAVKFKQVLKMSDEQAIEIFLS